MSTVGKNGKAIQEYVKNQEKEDMLYEQISIKEYMAPNDPDKNNTNNKFKK